MVPEIETAPSSPESPTNDSPAPPSSQIPPRNLWLEVLAVLAIGVLPNLSSAIALYAHNPAAPPPYWLDSLDLCLRSACVSFAVLYLIHRSGESFASFGIARPHHSDLWFGLFLYLIATFLYRNVWPFMPDDGPPQHALYPVPKTSLDYLLMFPRYAANGFAEELVTRAYLITRLELLLRSRASAVLLAALCFASYHLYAGLGFSLFMVLFGLAYGGMFLLLRRIWPLALGHMLICIRLEL